MNSYFTRGLSVQTVQYLSKTGRQARIAGLTVIHQQIKGGDLVINFVLELQRPQGN